MQIVDTGVLTPSFMDFSLPSEFAKSALYYCPQFGQFICNSDYRIERNGIDQYLLIYINSGSLCIRTDGMSAEAHEGEIALFDCRKPHCYWCPDKVDFYWFHFNGAGSKQYTEYLTERFGLVHEKQPMLSLKDQFRTVVHSAQYGMSTQFASMNEHQISIAVHSILGGLASQTVRTTVTSELLAPALAYIHGHLPMIFRWTTLPGCAASANRTLSAASSDTSAVRRMSICCSTVCVSPSVCCCPAT